MPNRAPFATAGVALYLQASFPSQAQSQAFATQLLQLYSGTGASSFAAFLQLQGLTAATAVGVGVGGVSFDFAPAPLLPAAAGA